MFWSFGGSASKTLKCSPCRYLSAGGHKGSTFIRPNEKRRKERKLRSEEREFPGISIGFLEKQCGMIACVWLCECERHGVRQSGGVWGGLPLPESHRVKTHMVRFFFFLSKWKYLVWSSLSGRQHLEVVKVQRRWKGSTVWRSGSEPGVPLSRTG